MKKNLFRLTGLIMSLMLALSLLNCGGGGGGGSSTGGGGTTTTDDGITVPAAGSSGTVTLTGGTNKYGFQKMWKTGITSYPNIKNIFKTTDTDSGDELCIYFADNNIYLFVKVDNTTWYLISCYSYTYNSGDYTFTATGSNTINSCDDLIISWGKIIIDGDTARILSKIDKSYEFYHCLKQDSFSETVTSLDDATWALWNSDYTIDNSITCATINSLSASYSSGTVTVNYDITAPAGKEINYIRVEFISPTLYEKVSENPDYFIDSTYPVYGQIRQLGITVTQGYNVNGSANISLVNPENGTWRINQISVICSDSTSYHYRLDLDGNWQSTYYFEGDDDKYKNTSIAAATFTVSGSTPDTTPPTLSSISVSGTTITVNASGTLGDARILYVPDNDWADNTSTYVGGSLSGSTATFDCSGAAAGTYYITMIALYDTSGNCSLYFGYDTDVSYWNGDFTSFGLDFSVYNRFWAGEQLPTATAIGLKTFTK